jgi:hypothetical protein
MEINMNEQQIGQAYAQLGICQAFAPNGQAQEGFARIMREMQADGKTDRTQVAVLAGALVTGLAYGNWPRDGIH